MDFINKLRSGIGTYVRTLVSKVMRKIECYTCCFKFEIKFESLVTLILSYCIEIWIKNVIFMGCLLPMHIELIKLLLFLEEMRCDSSDSRALFYLSKCGINTYKHRLGCRSTSQSIFLCYEICSCTCVRGSTSICEMRVLNS